ncbi:MAG: M48 family metalloprotease, partial [Deltaproteobacteria bacterium]|nr:M48 family metalloprotease [Deltaproteobacteria bacterium]
MTKRVFSTLFFILILVTFSASQTVIKPPENKFKVEDDLKIGKETSEKIEGQYPLLKDEEVIKYIQGIGLKLSRAIPPYLTNNKFQFVFKVLDVSDENAWALPGGRIYLHRGLLTIVRNESELAGIIAHEMSHVILRHTTAKMTQIENPVNKLIINILVLEG